MLKISSYTKNTSKHLNTMVNLYDICINRINVKMQLLWLRTELVGNNLIPHVPRIGPFKAPVIPIKQSLLI